MTATSHNYSVLEKRWNTLAQKMGWHITTLYRESDYPVLAIQNDAAQKSVSGGFYLSAGVHGDECAPVWALLNWAETNGSSPTLDDRPLVILPCLNPHGLINNERLDSHGIDLNRNFQNADLPLIQEWQDFLRERQFDLALNLHEDYDSGGIYLYELSRNKSLGDRLLAACEEIIPRETATEIDGTEMLNGLLKRTDDIERIAEEDLGGWPEAIWLHLKHSTDSFTFETPSEMDLDRRINAHERFIETAIQSQSQ